MLITRTRMEQKVTLALTAATTNPTSSCITLLEIMLEDFESLYGETHPADEQLSDLYALEVTDPQGG